MYIIEYKKREEEKVQYTFEVGEKVGGRVWTGKCYGCGVSTVEESKKDKVHWIVCKDCRMGKSGRSLVFWTMEAVVYEERNWGNRAFE